MHWNLLCNVWTGFFGWATGRHIEMHHPAHTLQANHEQMQHCAHCTQPWCVPACWQSASGIQDQTALLWSAMSAADWARLAKIIIDTHTVQEECLNELYRAFLSSFVQRKCLQPKQIHLKYDTYSVALPSSGQPGIILGFSLNWRQKAYSFLF